jgi:hypothetical protein
MASSDSFDAGHDGRGGRKCVVCGKHNTRYNKNVFFISDDDIVCNFPRSWCISGIAIETETTRKKCLDCHKKNRFVGSLHGINLMQPFCSSCRYNHKCIVPGCDYEAYVDAGQTDFINEKCAFHLQEQQNSTVAKKTKPIGMAKKTELAKTNMQKKKAELVKKESKDAHETRWTKIMCGGDKEIVEDDQDMAKKLLVDDINAIIDKKVDEVLSAMEAKFKLMLETGMEAVIKTHAQEMQIINATALSMSTEITRLNGVISKMGADEPDKDGIPALEEGLAKLENKVEDMERFGFGFVDLNNRVIMNAGAIDFMKGMFGMQARPSVPTGGQ